MENGALQYILQHLDSCCCWHAVCGLHLSIQHHHPRSHPSSLCQLPPVSGSQTSWQTGGSRRGWGTLHPAPEQLALATPRDVCSPHCSCPITNDCTSGDQSAKPLKFADDAMVINLIWSGDESAHRWEVEQLARCCGQNNLGLNMLKTGNDSEFQEEPELAQEVQPALGTADPFLHLNHPVCSLHIHHCLVWICHQTGQEQTTTDSQDCRDNHWH